MLHYSNQHFEPSRAVLSGEDWRRAPFLKAMEQYLHTKNHVVEAKYVETIIRTSRLCSGDTGLLPDQVQEALGKLTNHFRGFGPKEFSMPQTYDGARELIKTFFF